jgi:hypothetical protein
MLFIIGGGAISIYGRLKQNFQTMTRELKRAAMSEFREFWTVEDFQIKIKMKTQ